MKDVAALAGVGTKTVSRVMNGESRVSPETALRVTRAAHALDYHVDMHAGSLRRRDGRSRSIGLLVGNVGNPFAGAIHRAVEDAANARGVDVLASSLDEDPQREMSAVAGYLRRRVDGLILTCAAPSQAYLIPTMERGTPIVFVDRAPVGVEADVVASDSIAGARRATRHLIDHGHRRIAFLSDKKQLETAQRRREGFLAELASAGIATNEVSITADITDEHEAQTIVGRLLDGPEPPSAIFSGQNLITIGALHALRTRALQHRVALIGFDDVPLADLLDPGVSVIAQDPARIGREAAHRLFSRLDNPDQPVTQVIVPTQLIVRGSGEIHP